jgi:thymidylate synthase ThyX
MNVEVLKYPTQEDWNLCKMCALNTAGFSKMVNEPDEKWKKAILRSEHSPIRVLQFCFKIEMPYWVSVHYVRHKFGVEHFVSTQRDDRTKDTVSRADKPQGEMVSHIIYLNAAELVQICPKRLCMQASPETREVCKAIVEAVVKTNPEFKEVLVPLCEYRNGLCTEFFPCGRFKNSQKADEDDGK